MKYLTIRISKIFLLLLINTNLFAQFGQKKLECGVIDSIIKIIPIDFSKQEKTNSTNLLDNPAGVIVIPVVFHILYDPSVPEQNVARESVDYLLSRLNEDLTARNGDLTNSPRWNDRLGNVNVMLKMACIDPNGNNMAEEGIVRKQVTNPNGFRQLQITSAIPMFPEAQLSILGGDDAWPTDTYLNVWVGDYNSVYGWGSYPWFRPGSSTFQDLNGQTHNIPNEKFDGIVLDYTCFPVDITEPIPLSLRLRTATHEVGHWLGLYHIYNGCGSPVPPGCYTTGDKVCDTPPQQTSTLGCPMPPVYDNMCGTVGLGVMFENYMDLSSSICRHLFSHQQADRTRSYFTSISNGGPDATRFPFLVNYFSIQKQSGTPPVEPVQNNTITIKLNNPACLDVTYTFTGPVTELSHTNQQIVFSVDCPSTGTVSLSVHSNDLYINNFPIIGNYIDSYVFNFDNSQCSSCNAPTISPNGPIEICVQYETGAWSITLSTNLTSNIQWYENGIALNGQTSSIFNYNGSSNCSIGNWPICTNFITVKNTLTGCISDPVKVTRKSFSSPQVYLLPETNGTPTSYCISQGGPIKQVPSSTDPNTIYWWEVYDPNGNPASGVSISPMYTTNPNATITFPAYPYNTATIVAKALDNGCSGATDNSWIMQYTIALDLGCKLSSKSTNTTNVSLLDSINNSPNITAIASQKIKLLPNPANTEVVVNSTKSILRIEIYNSVGSLIRQIKGNGKNSFKINVKELKSGFYIFKILTNTGLDSQKLIIQR